MKTKFAAKRSVKQRRAHHSSADPNMLLERSFLQWSILDSIGHAVLSWIIICTWLFWRDAEANAFSLTGVTFILLGLFLFADIFGVLLHKTNYFIMVWQKRVNPPFPSLKKLKQLSWIANIFWFIVMLLSAQYLFDLVYEFVYSLFNYNGQM